MTTKKSHNEDIAPEVALETAVTKSELFFQKNGKIIIILICVLALAIGGYFSYQHFYITPRSLKASDAMFQAQSKFQIDSFEMAINGNSQFMGFKEIATKFSGTPEANLANHYIGISYLRMQKFQDAIDWLTKFKPENSSVGIIISAQNLGLTGDAYSELGKYEDALKYYEKAANFSDNDATAPMYIKKAATVLFHLGKYPEALAQYQKIKSNYPSSFEAQDIDKLIAATQLQF